jgi:putative endonuclease
MELDIIAEYNRVLVFIEVKARSTTTFGFPEEAVNALKQEMIRKASTHFLKRIRHNGEIRFDIISLIINHKKEVKEIYHIEDAFFPGL